MPVQRIRSTARGTGSGRSRPPAGTTLALGGGVAELSYGELAMAIHVSGKPLSRLMTAAEAAALAVEGLRRLGLSVVREQTERDRLSNVDMTEGRLGDAAWRRSHRATWWSERRAQDAHDLAYRVQTAHRAAVAA